MILVCDCGQRLNAPGAAPGRVGKCPRCGSFLRVSDPAPVLTAAGPPRVASEPTTTGSPVVAPAAVYHPPRAGSAARSGRPRRADGLVVVPNSPESSLRGSWDYPLRNASGVALLLVLPPLLWFGSIPLFWIAPEVLNGSAATPLLLAAAIPPSLFLGYVVGHLLVFLGDVVVTSCLGDPALPREVTWIPGAAYAGWGRWLLAGAFGGVVGGLPALIYWVWCGDVDWLDRVVLLDLALPGIAYAQMAIVAAQIHESGWAVAHPLVITRLIARGGWGYLGPCLVTTAATSTMVGSLVACAAIHDPLLRLAAWWAWWLVGLYLAVVALRNLGLFCHRRRLVTVRRRSQVRG